MLRPKWDGSTVAGSHCKCVPTALRNQGRDHHATMSSILIWNEFCDTFGLPPEDKFTDDGTIWPKSSPWPQSMGSATGRQVPLEPSDIEAGLLKREAEILANAREANVTVKTWTDWAHQKYPNDMAQAIRGMSWMPAYSYPVGLQIAMRLYLLEDYHQREKAMANAGSVSNGPVPGAAAASGGHGPFPWAAAASGGYGTWCAAAAASGGNGTLPAAAGASGGHGPLPAAAAASAPVVNPVRRLVEKSFIGCGYETELGSFSDRLKSKYLQDFGHAHTPSEPIAMGGNGDSGPGFMVTGDAGTGDDDPGTVSVGDGCASGATGAMGGDGSEPGAMTQSGGHGTDGGLQGTGMGGTGTVAMSGAGVGMTSPDSGGSMASHPTLHLKGTTNSNKLTSWLGEP